MTAVLHTQTLAATGLSRSDVLSLFLALAVMLALARLMGELARRLRQPTVLGEILAGVVLGPTVLGRLNPGAYQFLFPAGLASGDGAAATASPTMLVLEGLTALAIVLFLFVAGMEVDLARLVKQGWRALVISTVGLAAAFGLGFVVAVLSPGWMGSGPEVNRYVFALFAATAMAISALPVIAKTLMDLNLYRTDLGMVIVAAAILNDLAGWFIFALILGLIGAAGEHAPPLQHTIGLTVVYTLGMLVVGRWLIHHVLPWMQAHLHWPGGVIGFVLALALFGAAFTESIGIHAVFGAFLVGIAVGDTPRLHVRTRDTLNQFISFFFAPLFFAYIGLRVDFAAHFDPLLVLTVVAAAMVGKVLGCRLAARGVGMERREAWALGLGMTATGAMGIIFGLLGLQYGVIDERLYVALVVLAIVSSSISGPAMELVLRRPKPRRATDFLSPKRFIPQLRATTRQGVIEEFAELIGPQIGRIPAAIRTAVMERERMMSTGLPGGLAVPHARLEGLAQPVVGVGISAEGVDFEAFDGRPAHVVFLVLTPLADHGAQLEILADIARTFRDPRAIEPLRQATGYTQFLAAVRSELARPEAAHEPA